MLRTFLLFLCFHLGDGQLQLAKLLHQQGRSFDDLFRTITFSDAEIVADLPLLQKWMPSLNLEAANLESGHCSEDMQMLKDSITRIFNKLFHNGTMNDFDSSVTLPLIDSQGSINGGLLKGHTQYYGRWNECRKIKYKLSNGRFWRGEIFRAFIGSINETTKRCQKPLLGIDLCLPKSCSSQEIKRAISQEKTLSGIICDIANNDSARTNQVDAGTYIVAIFVFVVLGLGILSGFVDYFLTNDLKDVVSVNEENVLWRILFAFSLYRNTKSIFSTKGLNKAGQIGPLHCMRFFSMCWIIMGHVNEFLLALISNPLEVMKVMGNLEFEFLTNAYLSVDTFFYIGGLLLAFIWFKELKKNKKNVMSSRGWLMFYVHRILRLSPVFYITVLFWMFVVLPMLPDSEMMFQFVYGPHDPCRETWWAALLYVQNFVHYTHHCYTVSWYLATDMQMYLFTPLLLIPFTYSAIAGIFVSILVIILSTIAHIITIYRFHYPPGSFQAPGIYEDPKESHMSEYAMYIYNAPWIRCQVYIIGILVGYVLQTRKLRINKFINIVMWGCAIALMLTAVFGLHHYSNGWKMPTFWRAMYSAFSRPCWGLGLAWITISSFYGRGSIINTFMSWSGWAPLSRLTYCAYLIHIMVIYYVFSIHNREIIWNSYLDVFLNFALPAIVVTYLIAILWSSCFEISVGKLEMMIFGGVRRRNVQPEGEKKQINVENGEMKTSKKLEDNWT